ncbi:MAG: hypothetical protein HY921_03690 [Elusimicrobia bacterium]|nr:hypothetical protein [Elusimicrobiota bacterium]
MKLWLIAALLAGQVRAQVRGRAVYTYPQIAGIFMAQTFEPRRDDLAGIYELVLWIEHPSAPGEANPGSLYRREGLPWPDGARRYLHIRTNPSLPLEQRDYQAAGNFLVRYGMPLLPITFSDKGAVFGPEPFDPSFHRKPDDFFGRVAQCREAKDLEGDSSNKQTLLCLLAQRDKEGHKIADYAAFVKRIDFSLGPKKKFSDKGGVQGKVERSERRP